MDWKILIGVIVFLISFFIYQQCSDDSPTDFDKAQAAERAARERSYNQKQVKNQIEKRDAAENAARKARNGAGGRNPEKVVTLETNEFKARLSSRGATLQSFVLKDDQYKEHPRNWSNGLRDKDAPLVTIDLVTTNPAEKFWAAFPLRLHFYEGLDGLLPDADYEVVRATEREVVFRYIQEGQPVVITRKYEIDSSDRAYHLWLTTRIRNTGQQKISFRPGTIQTGYQHESEAEGSIFTQQPNLMESVCAVPGDIFHAPWEEMEAPFTATKVQFAGVQTNYFMSAMVPADGFPTTCRATAESSGVVRTDLQWGEMDLAPGEDVVLRIKNYIGPKQYQRLEAIGNNLQESVDYGFFAPISRILLWLMFIFQGWVVNWGLAIILLTVAVKLVLTPLTHRSFVSAEAMKSLKPEVDKINDKFKDDPQEKQKAIWALYKQKGVNPFGGCLPMLLQMPIWFALFQTLRASPELYRAHFFGWITDLSSPDPYFVTPVVMGGLMYLQQRMMPAGADNAQAKMLLYMMPIMFTGMMLFLPSGLTLYILVNTVLSILHQMIIHRTRKTASAG